MTPTPVTRFALPAIVLLLCLGVALMARGSTPDAPAPAETGSGAGYMLPPVTWHSLLAVEASEAVALEHVADVSTAHSESGSASDDASGEGAQADATAARESAASPAIGTPGIATPPPATDFASLAACGIPCWGERLTRAEVYELAMRGTGDAAWAEWASWCFTADSAESGGYVAAVGGPNHHPDGEISWDLGIGQSNTRTLAGFNFDAARVLEDVEYAMDALYVTYREQGTGAWLGCRG